MISDMLHLTEIMRRKVSASLRACRILHAPTRVSHECLMTHAARHTAANISELIIWRSLPNKKCATLTKMSHSHRRLTKSKLVVIRVGCFHIQFS